MAEKKETKKMHEEKKIVETQEDHKKNTEKKGKISGEKSEKSEKEKSEKEVKKAPIKKKEIKKEYAFVNGKGLPISTKQAVAICKFITSKKISQARKDLEEVIKKKRAVPIKGEIAHKKGKGMMSGKYPIKASKIFIEMLKNLGGNTITNNLENPIISEAIANKASRPMAKFGRWERKRTHVKIIAKDIRQNKTKK